MIWKSTGNKLLVDVIRSNGVIGVESVMGFVVCCRIEPR